MAMRRPDRFTLLSLALLLGSAVVPACSCGDDSASSSTGTGDGDGDGDGDGGSGPGNGGSGPGVTVGPSTGVGGSQQGAFIIEPQNPSLDIEYGTAGQTIQFSAVNQGNPVNGVAWFLSTPEAGTITADGLFTANGLAGGQITVGARLEGESATTTLSLNLHLVENLGAVPQTDIDILTNPAPGSTDAAWATWYPYMDTVFPRGVPAPSWQFATGSQASTSYYLQITGTNLSYEGFLAPENGQQSIRPSQAAWDAMGTASDGTPFDIKISKVVGGQKIGPISHSIKLARGKLKGTIYYNTYSSPLAGSAAVMRIRGDLTTPEALLPNCRVCHSVSADGSTVATADHNGNGGTFDLNANPDNPPLVWTDPELAAFAGLYPDGGQVLITNGTPGNSWPPNTPGSSFQATSTLRMRDGTVIPNSGIEPYYAQTPIFSHDGTMVAFYNRPVGGGTGVLAAMDFDLAAALDSDPATIPLTNYRVLATPPAGRHYAWPAYTPDNRFVIYQDGTGDDLATWNANTGRLTAVDVVNGEVKTFDNLNGDLYVPQGARDQGLNYEPSVLPLASGGYYWVMFTSRRTHGNTLLGGRGETKRLWVAALDLSPDAGADSSHPAFYVEGQEQAGNSRGFWALDPCKQDGEGCESGDQCCNGFCNPSPEDANVFVCGQPDGECSDEFESCEVASDCCDSTMECINGRCAQDDPIPN